MAHMHQLARQWIQSRTIYPAGPLAETTKSHTLCGVTAASPLSLSLSLSLLPNRPLRLPRSSVGSPRDRPLWRRQDEEGSTPTLAKASRGGTDRSPRGPMATPSPQALAQIKSAARKLPVKRRTPDPAVPRSSGAATVKTEGEGDEFEDEEEEEEEEEEGEGRVAGDGPPFKFQRIWSESDEIRFLQGLLACNTQGMTFPRDLNLYFDRFSETMSQPYTRSQLSEKLRRLRKKFRSHSVRVSRGLDPSGLSPHDRDLFHLSTLLWDPAFAVSSPFGSSTGSVPGNKRRRHIPVGKAMVGAPSSPPRPSAVGAAPSSSPPLGPPNGKRAGDLGSGSREDHESPLNLEKLFVDDRSGLGQMTAMMALDVFDSCLRDVRATLVRRGLLHSDQNLRTGVERDLSKRWREQRVAELDVLARRLRLTLGQAVEE
ncbi:unnamed protein product [Spirodela intermedia]|uniref:Glabrous enhancer-binding protein-like DBD domain-containing protein n=1 Tax=Spirodela intermedia TaxID=51605 RepID=A0A7I8KBX3_SPIIN|nr:unnamed protein product [Spirodela intermedia]